RGRKAPGSGRSSRGVKPRRPARSREVAKRSRSSPATPASPRSSLAISGLASATRSNSVARAAGTFRSSSRGAWDRRRAPPQLGHHRVGLGDQVEQRGQGGGDVQVVVEGGLEPVPPAARVGRRRHRPGLRAAGGAGGGGGGGAPEGRD